MGKQTCGQFVLGKDACPDKVTHSYVWPGSDGKRRYICSDHIEKLLSMAVVLGLTEEAIDLRKISD